MANAANEWLVCARRARVTSIRHVRPCTVAVHPYSRVAVHLYIRIAVSLAVPHEPFGTRRVPALFNSFIGSSCAVQCVSALSIKLEHGRSSTWGVSRTPSERLVRAVHISTSQRIISLQPRTIQPNVGTCASAAHVLRVVTSCWPEQAFEKLVSNSANQMGSEPSSRGHLGGGLRGHAIGWLSMSMEFASHEAAS